MNSIDSTRPRFLLLCSQSLALAAGVLVTAVAPGHAGILSEGGTHWLSCHFYDGTREGLSTLAILPLRWNTNGWPEVLLKPKSQT